jgi:hypothetical protein
MPIINLENPTFISVDGAGRPNSGGTVEVYVADGLFTTYAAIYSDQVKTSSLTNPVKLDDAGTKEIWFEVKVDIREKTKAGVLIRDTSNIDPNVNAAVSTSYNLATNGSFEVDSDSDGQPDNWTISPYTGSAIAITTAVVTDGVNALEFNTGAAGSGGGTATSAKFPVTEGSVCQVSWSFYATNATTTNTFQIKWYDEDDVVQSTSTITMPASGSVPTSWTRYSEDVTVDAAGTQGEIVLTGISTGGSNLSSKAYFDGIIVTNQSVINLRGGITEPVIYDSSGNEIIKTAKVASAVNEITITNAITATPPVIASSGEADIGIDFENSEGEELLQLEATATAVNNIKIINAITTTRPVIQSAGEADIGIDFENSEGEELLELIATPTAVNNVRITNAATGNAAKIDASETNSDLDFPRNGTGEITVDSTPIYGLVILDTPILLVTDTAVGATSKTNIDITAHTTGVATKAILRTNSQMYSASTAFEKVLYVGEADETFSSVHIATRLKSTPAAAHDSVDSNTVTVNLKSGEIFAYEITVPVGGGNTHTTTIHLIGYYV